MDRQIAAPDDQPTIGLLLCKSENRLVAEYALSGVTQPMGVAEYQLVRALPEPLDTKLPTIEELEAELNAAERRTRPVGRSVIAQGLSRALGGPRAA